jgi:hypothetical protein
MALNTPKPKRPREPKPLGRATKPNPPTKLTRSNAPRRKRNG